MRYQEIPPAADLRHLVDSFWILESGGAASAPQRVVPDGHPELILNSRCPFEALQSGAWRRQPRLFLAGQIEGPLLLRPAASARVFGIRFHPYGAAGLFGPRMHELAGKFAPVGDLSPELARDLTDAIENPSPLPRIASALRHAHNRVRVRDSAVEEAVRRVFLSPEVDVACLARSLAISPRQFERRFRSAVGLPPKLFSRMQRFLRVFRAVERSRSWVDTAIACGYYDQAHLIRDCKRFSGETPAALLAVDADLARYFLQRFGVSHPYKTAGRGPV